ncbi:MAG: hypothetical protein AAFV51_08700 [Pseudomonadota bacterium]
MAGDKPYQLAVLGAEPSGFAAAAVAALGGLRTVLIPAGWEHAAPAYAARPGAPADVWRRLALHRSGARETPVSACVSLRAEGRASFTYKSEAETRDALAERSEADAAALAEFEIVLERARAHAQSLAGALLKRNGSAHAADPYADEASARALRHLTQPYRAVLADYFADPEVRAHVASRSLNADAISPYAYGSFGAFADALDPEKWPVRDGSGANVAAALRECAVDAGVDIGEFAVTSIEEEKVGFAVSCGDGGTLRARKLLAASQRSARAAGVAAAGALRRGRAADATEVFVKLGLSQQLQPPSLEAENDTLFTIADSLGEIQRAFDQARDGAWPDKPPVVFELSDDRREIFARAPVAPGRFFVDGEARGWSEQDRQAFATRIVRRLSERLDGVDRTLRRTEVFVVEGPLDENGAPREALRSDNVMVAGGAGGDIGEAVRLVDVLLKEAGGR